MCISNKFLGDAGPGTILTEPMAQSGFLSGTYAFEQQQTWAQRIIMLIGRNAEHLQLANGGEGFELRNFLAFPKLHGAGIMTFQQHVAGERAQVFSLETSWI